MKFRLFSWGLLIAGMTSVSWGAWVEVNSPIANRVPAVEVRSVSDNIWQMEISIPGLVHETLLEEEEVHDVLSLPGEMMASGDGEAGLPLISRMIALRTSGNPEIEIVSEEWQELEGTYHLALDMESAQAEELASAYEQRDDYFPVETIGVTDRQVLGGVSLAVLHVRAARYNPARGKVQVLRSAEIRLHETGSAVSYDRAITETTAGLLRAVVPNWDEMGLDAFIIRGTLLYIVANNTSVQDGIEELVTWRERKGFTVEVAGPNQIGSMTTTNIKNYIQGRYNSADPALEFVCLVGDADGSYYIPSYQRTGFWYGDAGPGDWDYARLDGTDMLPDVAIGRFCFNSTTELEVLVNKTLLYERDPAPPSGASNPSWFKGGALLSGNNDWNNSGISTVQLMRWTRERMLEIGYTSSSIDTIYYIHEDVTYLDVDNAIDSGISLFCYRGEQFLTNFNSSDITNLSNGRRMPFMIVITCGTNDYDTDDGSYSICEHLVKAGTVSTPKGAIGAVGTSTIETRTRYNNCVTAGVLQGLLREEVHTMGGSLSRSKLELKINYPVDSAEAGFFCHITTLLGDPAVDIYTDTPEQLYVDNPGSIPVGTTSLTLTVTGESAQPVEGVYVNLLKGTEVFMGDWTDTSGEVVFNFITTTEDSLFVTATKHNCRPAINYTLVSTSGYVAPESLTFTIDDDNSGESQGDNSGVANPGETIEVAVILKNWGPSTVTGVDAELSTSDAYVASINDNTESYGAIVSGGTASPGDDFDFTIADYAPDGYVLQFDLTVTDDVPTTWESGVPILVSNGNLEFFSYNLSGIIGDLDPGESGELSLRLDNIGTRETHGAIAYLRSGRSTVVITDSVGTFTASTAGGQCDNTGDKFGFSVINAAFSGERVPIMCIFTVASGFADTIEFELLIDPRDQSMAPTPCDEYGYVAFDNTDIEYNKHPTYSWVELDPRYGGSGATQLNIYDYSDEDDATKVVNLPFTFRYYGEEFTQISVCSNGWIAMGADQAVHTAFRNWRIPAALGPEAMIAPFWDDLFQISYNGSVGRIYYYHDSANHRFIVEWSRTKKYNGGIGPTETFECILYEPGYPVTPTGDGEILFQYNTISNTTDVSGIHGANSNDYATVGIENLDESDGVLFSYFNLPGPNATSVANGCAILFTTQRFELSDPKAPENLTAIRSGDDIELRWNEVDEDIYGNPITVTGYNIYRDTSPDFTPGGGNLLDTAPSASYTDTGAVSGDKYFYVVQASVTALVSSERATLEK